VGDGVAAGDVTAATTGLADGLGLAVPFEVHESVITAATAAKGQAFMAVQMQSRSLGYGRCTEASREVGGES
jgi:hypothetical protein